MKICLDCLINLIMLVLMNPTGDYMFACTCAVNMHNTDYMSRADSHQSWLSDVIIF